MSAPPSDLERDRAARTAGSTASTAATNGCRFAASVARAGRSGGGSGTRGCSSARAGRAWRTRAAPRSPTRGPSPARGRDGMPTSTMQDPGARDDDGAHARRRVRPHQRRDGDRVRSPGRASRAPGGCRRVAAGDVASRADRDERRRRRPRSPRRPRSAASSRSRPSASPKSAAKIGIAPRSRPIVDAVVASSASTNES